MSTLDQQRYVVTRAVTTPLYPDGCVILDLQCKLCDIYWYVRVNLSSIAVWVAGGMFNYAFRDLPKEDRDIIKYRICDECIQNVFNEEA